MTKGWVCVAVILGLSWDPSKATQDLATPMAHVVRLESKFRGAGVVVGRTGTRVRIVTAKHNITGDPESPATHPACAEPLQVHFYWDRGNPRTSVAVRCSPALDLAVVDVELPPGTPDNRIPGLKIANEAEAIAGAYEVRVIGHPNASGWNVAVHHITQPRDEIFPEAFHTVEFKERAVIRGPEDIRIGYSGGPIVDAGGALVGVVLDAGDAKGLCMRWSRVDTFLKELRVEPDLPAVGTLLEGRTAPLNPQFAPDHIPNTADEEAIRGVLLLYIDALAQRREPLVRAVRPDVNASDLAALFGDSKTIALQLTNCQLAVAARDGRVTCAYMLKIGRRTGADREVRLSDAVFHFRRPGVSWVIAGIQ